MASGTTSLPVCSAFGQTARTDAWWVQPVAVFLGLGLAIAYLTLAAFQGEYYTFGNYLSPLYSPELFGDTPHALFGPRPSIWPEWLPWSPAFLILWERALHRHGETLAGRTKRPEPELKE